MTKPTKPTKRPANKSLRKLSVIPSYGWGIEYGILASLIAVAIVAVLVTVGPAIGRMFEPKPIAAFDWNELKGKGNVGRVLFSRGTFNIAHADFDCEYSDEPTMVCIENAVHKHIHEAFQHPEAAGFIEIESPGYLKRMREAASAAATRAANEAEERKHGKAAVGQ